MYLTYYKHTMMAILRLGLINNPTTLASGFSFNGLKMSFPFFLPQQFDPT